MCCPCFNQATCWAKTVVIGGFILAPILMIVIWPVPPSIREDKIYTELCMAGPYCVHDSGIQGNDLLIGAEMFTEMRDQTISGYAEVDEYGPIEMEYFGIAVARTNDLDLLGQAKERHAAARKIARGNKHISPHTMDLGNVEHLAHAADVSSKLLPSLPKFNRKQMASMAKHLKGFTKKPVTAAGLAPGSKTHLLEERRDDSEPWRLICPTSDLGIPGQYMGREGGFVISRGGINLRTNDFEFENPRTDSTHLGSHYVRVTARPTPLRGVTSALVYMHMFACAFSIAYADANSTDVPECQNGGCLVGFKLGSNGPTEIDNSLAPAQTFPAGFGWDFTASNVQVIRTEETSISQVESKGFKSDYDLFANSVGGFVFLTFVFWAIPIGVSICMCSCPAKFAQDPAAATGRSGASVVVQAGQPVVAAPVVAEVTKPTSTAGATTGSL